MESGRGHDLMSYRAQEAYWKSVIEGRGSVSGHAVACEQRLPLVRLLMHVSAAASASHSCRTELRGNEIQNIKVHLKKEARNLHCSRKGILANRQKVLMV